MTTTEVPISAAGFPEPWKIAPHHVYEAYASDGTCLYVGCTTRLGGRLRTQEAESDWWKDAVRFLVTTYPDEASGFAAERAAIKMHQPRHNVVHTDEHKMRGGWDTRRRNLARARAAEVAS